MKTQLKIESVNYFEEYKLQINFSDGESQLVDFKPFLETSQNPEIKNLTHPSIHQELLHVYQLTHFFAEQLQYQNHSKQ